MKMQNLWPENFDIKDSKPVKEILDEQSSFLPKLTKGMVYAETKSMSPTDKIFGGHENDFSYSFYIKGQFLTKYSFKILDISHPITLYPVLVSVDSEVATGLELESHIEINNETEFSLLLEKVFRSEQLVKIIGSIMKLSPKQVT
jgi:hypothetical protein